MAKKKIVEETQETPQEVPAPKSLKNDAIEAHVMNKGHLVRIYSLAVHGENFEALAQEFASDRDGHEVVLK